MGNVIDNISTYCAEHCTSKVNQMDNLLFKDDLEIHFLKNLQKSLESTKNESSISKCSDFSIDTHLLSMLDNFDIVEDKNEYFCEYDVLGQKEQISQALNEIEKIDFVANKLRGYQVSLTKVYRKKKKAKPVKTNVTSEQLKFDTHLANFILDAIKKTCPEKMIELHSTLDCAIKPDVPEPRGSRITESDAILCRLRIPQDKFEAKINQNVKEIESINKKVKDFVAAGNKTQAKYELNKKKIIKENTENLQCKLNLIEKQQNQIKKAVEDESFTKVVSDSNNILEGILRKVKLDEIQYAKELAEETKVMQNQINEQTADDHECDIEIQDELNQLIAKCQYESPVIKIKKEIFTENNELFTKEKTAMVLN